MSSGVSFPLFRSIDDPEALEEERRLFYVGLTRAQDMVYLSRARNRGMFGSQEARTRSRFLGEIDANLLECDEPAGVPDPGARPARRERRERAMADAHPDYEFFSQEETMLRSGMRVIHEHFGSGTVLRVEGRGNNQKVVVRFSRYGLKKLLLRFANFELPGFE